MDNNNDVGDFYDFFVFCKYVFFRFMKINSAIFNLTYMLLMTGEIFVNVDGIVKYLQRILMTLVVCLLTNTYIRVLVCVLINDNE